MCRGTSPRALLLPSEFLVEREVVAQSGRPETLEFVFRDVLEDSKELCALRLPRRHPSDHVAEALPFTLLFLERLVHVVGQGHVFRHLVLCMHIHMYIL